MTDAHKTCTGPNCTACEANLYMHSPECVQAHEDSCGQHSPTDAPEAVCSDSDTSRQDALLRCMRSEIDELRAIISEVHSWIICAAVAAPGDMMQNALRISQITEPEYLGSTPTPQARLDVLIERRRQIEVEGYTLESDLDFDAGRLAAASSSYSLYAADQMDPFSQGDGQYTGCPPATWPFAEEFWKPKDPRTALVKSAALAIAEVERLDAEKGDHP